MKQYPGLLTDSARRRRRLVRSLSEAPTAARSVPAHTPASADASAGEQSARSVAGVERGHTRRRRRSVPRETLSRVRSGHLARPSERASRFRNAGNVAIRPCRSAAGGPSRHAHRHLRALLPGTSAMRERERRRLQRVFGRVGTISRDDAPGFTRAPGPGPSTRRAPAAGCPRTREVVRSGLFPFPVRRH